MFIVHVFVLYVNCETCIAPAFMKLLALPRTKFGLLSQAKRGMPRSKEKVDTAWNTASSDYYPTPSKLLQIIDEGLMEVEILLNRNHKVQVGHKKTSQLILRHC